MKEIYLAGGCFWGTEKYFQNLKGIMDTKVGYVNGKTQNPTYEDVCYKNTGHAEAVYIKYNEQLIILQVILDLYYRSINPVSINRQGGDTGSQYRTGIYYKNRDDEVIIKKSLEDLQKKYVEKIAIEVEPLVEFYEAEEYHQKYLDKHPSGYCHISKNLINQVQLEYN